MAFADTQTDSPYAPPRAGRLAGFWRLWFAVVRRGRLGPVFAAARGLVRSAGASVAGAVIVPTLGFYLLPHPLWRRIGPSVFWIALFFAFTEFGRPLGGAAFGLAAAAHGIGAAACSDFRVGTHYRYLRRVLRRLLVALAAALVIAVAAPRFAALFVVAVSDKDGRPVLISTTASNTHARVGDLVAYRLPQIGYAHGHEGVYIRGGIYWGRVLAVPPSRSMSFEAGRYVVDGVTGKSLPYMPEKSALEIVPDHVVIWPEAFQFQGRAAAAAFPPGIGLVAHSELVGRAYKRWFWHTQNP